MKRTIIATCILLVTLNACKKELTQIELVGVWSEIQPCDIDSNACYLLQFASNNKVYESSPGIDTGNYLLMDDNNIRIDSSIIYPGWQFTGSAVFQLTYSGDEITIKKFWTPLSWGGGANGTTPAPVDDLHLKKN